MSKTNTIRYAVVSAPALTTAAYLPRSYDVLSEVVYANKPGTLIHGIDDAGWTLNDYVLPRLSSGLYFGTEIDRATADSLERI